MSHEILKHEHEEPDSWHRHTPDEGPIQPEHGSHANPKVLVMTLIALIFGVAFVLIILIAFFNSYTSTFKASREETTALGQQARAAKAAAMERLNSVGWVDHDTVRIPIERAMERVVAERGNGG
ncbi:MAG: hypothetical protein D6695_09970 [Planctomycetota bacterium]|nr:MAG: hypothetical protein D6695_09970 [Planctomycetota bacterium]